jgi:hypothetical protein
MQPTRLCCTCRVQFPVWADHICSILFQRGVYPSDDFHMVKKYGQTVLVTQDLALENYLEKCAHSSAIRPFIGSTMLTRGRSTGSCAK